MIKIIFLWVVISNLVFLIKYILDRKQVISVRDNVIRVIYAAFTGALVVAVITLLNNIQGV